jgi:hypothetical protein
LKTVITISALAFIAILPAVAAEKPVPIKNAPGHETVENMCSGCHSLDYIRINSPYLDRQGWAAEVNKMIGAYGAPIPAQDVKAIVDYLAANYAAPAS